MPYQYTFSDAKESDEFKNISGVCGNSDEFKSILNVAMRRLIKRGGWFGSEVLMRFCIYNGCPVLPRQVAALIGTRFCNGEYEIRNHWYEIVGPHCGDGAGFNRTITETGTAPAYSEITGELGKYIRAYPTKLEDVGKTVTLFGFDAGSQPLQEKVGGVWRQGITLVLAAPYAQTSVLVKRITSVVRQATQANILLYEYDTASATQRDLALYGPTETNPRYRKYSIPDFCRIPTGCSTSNGVTLKTMEALVSLNFIPVVSDNDFLAIDDFDAIGLAIQSMRLEEANQDDQAELKMNKAVREMNFTERKMLPGMQTAVRVNATSYLQNPM